MLNELKSVEKFVKWMKGKENPTNWQGYLEMTAMWAEFVDAWMKGGTIPGVLEATADINPSSDNIDYTWIPVNKRLETQKSTVLPLDMVKELVAKTSHRAILRQCPCRQGFSCEHYPKDLGCVYMGESTKDFDPALAIHATVDQTIEHIDKAAIELGLFDIRPGHVGGGVFQRPLGIFHPGTVSKRSQDGQQAGRHRKRDADRHQRGERHRERCPA